MLCWLLEGVKAQGNLIMILLKGAENLTLSNVMWLTLMCFSSINICSINFIKDKIPAH